MELKVTRMIPLYAVILYGSIILDGIESWIEHSPVNRHFDKIILDGIESQFVPHFYRQN